MGYLASSLNLDLADDDILRWVLENQIRNERGDTLEFSNHFFLIDPLCDWSPNQVYLKAPQTGWTITMGVVKSIYAVKELGLNVGYTFPTRDMASTLVAEKFDQIIRYNDFIGKTIGPKEDVFQKQWGNSFLSIRGTFGEKEAIASTLDILIHDELDQSKREVVELYHSRLQFSKFKRKLVWSNPTSPNVGVGELWRESDQHHWFVECPHCGHRAFMDWFGGKTREKRNHTVERGVGAQARYVCGECHMEISEEARRTGDWRSKYPAKFANGKGWRGYWVNLMIAPWVPAQEMVDMEVGKSREYFYNMALGVPYQDEAVTVDRGVIFRNYNPVANSLASMAMGVDSGLDKHYVVGNLEGIVEVGVKRTWEEILEVQQKYRAICVIDSGPEITEPRRFIEALPGVFYVAKYQQDQAKQGNVRFGDKRDRAGWVYIDRNRTIQEVMEMWVEGRIKLSIRPQDLAPSFVKHYENMVRIKDVDALGRPKYSWEAANGEDHFCHAVVYWRAAMERANKRSSILMPKNYQEMDKLPSVVRVLQ